MEGRFDIKLIRKHEAMHLRSQNVFVPEYNRRQKTKYLLVENKRNIEILNKYLHDLRNK